MSTTLYMIFEPKTRFGEAITEPFADDSEAREAFTAYVREGKASLDVGQYLVAVTGDDEDVLNTVGEDLSPYVNTDGEELEFNFGDLPVTGELLEAVVVDNSRWGDDALGYVDDEFDESDEDYAITQ